MALSSMFEATEITAWKALSWEVSSSIDSFFQPQLSAASTLTSASSSSASLDACLDKLDAFLTTNCQPRYPNLVCQVLEALPEFDQHFLSRNQIHPKLLSVSYKHTTRLLTSLVDSALLPKQLKGALLLQGCAMRALQANANRTPEEEAKIQLFISSQLHRLLVAKLPNRTAALPLVALALLTLHHTCQANVNAALDALAGDDELIGDSASTMRSVCQVLARDDALLECFLTKLAASTTSPRRTLSTMLHQQQLPLQAFDTAVRVIAKMSSTTSSRTAGDSLLTLDAVLREPNVLDFLLLGRASECKQVPENWARVALQAVQYRVHCEEGGEAATPTNEEQWLRIELFCRLAWRIQPRAVLEELTTTRRAASHSNIHNRPLWLLLKLMPEELAPLARPFLMTSGSKSTEEEGDVRWTLERMVVSGRAGGMSDGGDAISLALAHIGGGGGGRFFPALCCQVLAANCSAVSSLAEAARVLTALQSSSSSSSTTASCAVVSAMARQCAVFYEIKGEGAEEEEDGVSRLAVHVLVRDGEEDECMAQERLHHLAELLAWVHHPAAFLRHLSPPQRQALASYLRNHRSSLSEAGTSSSVMTFAKPPTPPPASRTAAPPPPPSSSSVLMITECLDHVRRVCDSIPRSQLGQFEAQLVHAVQQQSKYK